MKNNETRTSAPVPRWTVWLGLLAWVVTLVLWTSRADLSTATLSADNLHNWASLTAWISDTLSLAGKNLACFVPVGFLSVFALRPRENWLGRILRRWLPAVAISFLLAALVHAFHPRPAPLAPVVAPGVLGLLTPWTGCLLGTWAGMAWARGTLARILFLPKLALLIAVLAGCAGAVIYRAVESSPASIEMPKVTSADRRHLYDVFTGKNPLKVREGETITLGITAHELNLLIAWGLSVENWPGQAAVKIERGAGELLASLPIRGRSRFVNVAARGTFSVREGNFTVRAERLRIGRIEIPRFLLAVLAPMVSNAVAGDPRLQPVLARVHSAELQSESLTVSYGHGGPPKGFVSRLFHDSEAAQIDIPAVHAQVFNLIASAAKMPRNSDARFGAAVRTAFRFAQDRSSSGGAVAENRAALLALGIALGHPHVETLMGGVMDEATRRALHNTYDGTTLRKRADWPKHFFVSAALTVIAERNVSDAGGLLKEEKDAAGGSGFSFGDLLADRTGTTFAQVATRDERSARLFQARLAQGFKVDEFFPNAADLPEGIQDADFQAHYGGTEGGGYRRLAAEIERRIASCAAYAGGPASSE
jgi:hypothetical protein